MKREAKKELKAALRLAILHRENTIVMEVLSILESKGLLNRDPTRSSLEVAKSNRDITIICKESEKMIRRIAEKMQD